MAGQKSLQGLRNEDKTRKCPECRGKIVYENEELVCEKCGLVID